MRDPAPMLPPHGTELGGGTLSLLGHEVRVRFLATGHHSRSYGIEIDGRVIGVMGKTEALAQVAQRLPTPMSIRHLGY